MSYNQIVEICRIVLKARGIKKFNQCHENLIYNFSSKQSKVPFDIRDREEIAQLFIQKLR